MKIPIYLSVLACATAALAGSTPAISGDYLEVRSCDIYTGSCFANAEMNLAGKEAMMVWSVREGSWKGTKLDGLAVVAVVKADGSMGDVGFAPRTGKAVLIVDRKADAKQRSALADFARTMGGKLVTETVAVRTEPIEAKLATCSKLGCASVKAGDLVQITTSCLGTKDHVCGNEETFYPPLSKVEGAYPVFADLASFTGQGLDCTWQIAGKRSAFLASFSTASTPERGNDVALAR
jgi:hypothetical protein